MVLPGGVVERPRQPVRRRPLRDSDDEPVRPEQFADGLLVRSLRRARPRHRPRARVVHDRRRLPREDGRGARAVIPLEWELLLSALLFVIGLYGVLVRTNAIVVLMSVEIMF